MTGPHVIGFTKSRDGLLFTRARIGGRDANALIDLGDPHVLQLSTSFVASADIPVRPARDRSADYEGNTFALSEGSVASLVVATVVMEEVPFLSGEGELEHVSGETGTRIDAVLGWGFFKRFDVRIDYRGRRILLSDAPLPIEAPAFQADLEEGTDYLVLNVVLDNIRCNLLIDTGSAYNVLDKTFFEAHPIKSSNVLTLHKFLFPLTLKRVRTRIGGHDVKVDYLIHDIAQVAKLDAVGLLGGRLLSRFVLDIGRQSRTCTFHEK